MCRVWDWERRVWRLAISRSAAPWTLPGVDVGPASREGARGWIDTKNASTKVGRRMGVRWICLAMWKE